MRNLIYVLIFTLAVGMVGSIQAEETKPEKSLTKDQLEELAKELVMNSLGPGPRLEIKGKILEIRDTLLEYREEGVLAVLEALKGVKKKSALECFRLFANLSDLYFDKAKEEDMISPFKISLNGNNSNVISIIFHLILSHKLVPLTPQLVPLLDTPNLVISDQAQMILISLNNKEIIPELVEMVKSGRKSVIRQAINVLGEIAEDNEEVKNIIRSKLQENPPEKIRSSCITALGELKDQESVPLLIKLIDSKDKWLNNRLAYALAKIGDKRAVEPLKELLCKETEEIQFSLLGALGKLGDKQALNRLFEIATQEQSEYLRKEAIAELEFASAPGLEKVLLDVYKELKRNNSSLRRDLLGILGRIGGEASALTLYNEPESDPLAWKRTFSILLICARRSSLVTDMLKGYGDDSKIPIIHTVCKYVYDSNEDSRGFIIESLISELRQHRNNKNRSISVTQTLRLVLGEDRSIQGWLDWWTANKDKYFSQPNKDEGSDE